MNEIAQFLMNHAGPALFLAIFAEQVGLPLPAAPVLVAAGALAADGALSPALAIGVTVVACVLADLIWFYLGRRGGGGLLGFLCRFSIGGTSGFGRTERLFARYGMSAVAAAKFVPGLGLLMPTLAGAFRIGVGKFLWFDALGSLLYVSFYLELGFLFRDEVNGVLESLSQLGLGTVALGSAFVMIFVACKYAQRRKLASAAARSASDAASRALATIPGARLERSDSCSL
jgi:membrane protein DedA with SNARE-associated domain